jgi:hypothetical protein
MIKILETVKTNFAFYQSFLADDLNEEKIITLSPFSRSLTIRRISKPTGRGEWGNLA